jgi:hypothetical protein
MAETKIKAAQFHGVVGHGTDGYFLMTNADGSMSWAQGGASGPSVTSVAYPGDDLAADPNPATPQTVVLTGTGFATSGMTVTIGGTAATAVAHDSNTQLTVTIPSKQPGDYDIVVTNGVTGASGTFVNGISYNGVPTWTTAAGSLGTFESETTISTITLAATEPDGGSITFNITNGALPSGLSLTGANIDGTTTAESSTTLYSFTIEAIDNENQSTPRNFSITVNSAEIVPSQNFTINTYTGNGSTQSIEGKIGTAAAFNGSSSYIDLPNLGISGSQSRTVSLWYNFNSLPSSGVDQLYSQGTNNLKEAFNIQLTTSGKIQVSYAGRELDSTTALSSGNWYHILVSYNGGNIETSTNTKIYINGSEETLINIGSSTGASNTINSNYSLGYRRNISSLYIDGKIDQVRIFNRALDETNDGEVTTLYNEPSNPSTASTTDIFDDHSGVALYEFEKGAIDTGGVSGYIGSGGIFNGSNSEINLPQILPPNSTSSSSFSCWFNTSDNSGTRQTIVNAYNLGGTSQAGWTLFKDAGNVLYLRSYYLDGSNITSTYGTINVSDGNWHHVAVIFDISANTLNVYLDNNSTPEISITGLTVSSVYIFESNGSIGYQTNSARHFNGKIDQVRIFSKALSSSEVTTLSDETSASSTKSTTDIFDDGSGVALYELEGNANTTPYYPYGEGAIDAGQSAVFNGSSSYIELSSGINTSYINPTSSWSFSAFINTLNASSGQVILGFDAYDNIEVAINTNSEIEYRIYNTSYEFLRSPAISSNKWYHVAATYSNGSMNLYLNGYNVASGTKTLIQSSSSPTIGKKQNNTTYFNGSIDQVRIYSSALSASDVEALASETNVPTTNLIAHYKLDGNGNDATSNYNGTATSITYSDPAEFPLIAYNGTATNVSYAYDGTPTNVSFVGTSFQPDFVWVKNRTSNWGHTLVDTVRGLNAASVYGALASDQTASETTNNVFGAIKSLDTNGFTTEGGSDVNGYYAVGRLNNDYVAWCWKAGGTVSANNNTDGTITSTVSANQDAGFSIVKYVGSSTIGLDIGHGLSSAPEMVILKNLDSSYKWYIYHKDTGTTSGYINYLKFDATIGTYSDKIFYPVDFNNSTFIAGHDTVLQGNMIAYCFHSVDGYQKVGSYTGTNATNAITTGFEPRFLMVKLTSAIDGNWVIYDNVRSGTNPRTKKLAANSNAQENDGSLLGGDSVHQVNFTSTGFELLETGGGVNTNKLDETYIYLAIA